MIRINIENVCISLNKLTDSILSLIYPRNCLNCGSQSCSTRTHLICDKCWSNIRVIKKPVCNTCGFPVSFNHIQFEIYPYICGDCKLEKKYYDHAAAACFYNDDLKHLVHKYKFDGYRALSVPFGDLIVQKYLTDDRFGNEEIIIPVPLHNKRKFNRGFNQSELLSFYLHSHTSIPLMNGLIRRIRNTEPQYNLSKKERIENLKNAFRVTNPKLVYGKRILLVDDIFTTGTTINEVSRELRKHKVKSINVLTLSRVID